MAPCYTEANKEESGILKILQAHANAAVSELQVALKQRNKISPPSEESPVITP